ncbi:MFS Git1p-like glycerophosphoinositol permease [Pholiota molesta]|nr:MFS Git1p-like glycerophosphoinositol permease [Pholiota molesta]
MSYSSDEKPLTRKQILSPYFTIAAAAFGLISDGYQNNLMTMANVVFKKLYPVDYTADVSTRVSNSLLVGAVIGQVIVGIICDRIGRKAALVLTTALIAIGATLATAAHGAGGSASGLFWFLTFARGLTGIGVGGEYPASSTSASEAANEKMIKHRGPVFIMVTNFVLSFGGPLAVAVFLIVLSAAGENHLQTVWRVCFGIGIALPLTVFYFRIRMLTTVLYQKGAIKRRVPYWLVVKRYWKTMLGTCGAWFLYDFITFPNGVFSGTIISSIIHDGNIKRTAEFQLLLGAIALPGVFIGALLCNPFGRRNTMMLGFGGYLIFGLIIGLSYDKITKIIPLFLCSNLALKPNLMIQSKGPGDMLGLVSAESYPTPIRGTCYGLSAAVGKAGAAIGTQAFTPIQVHLGKKWTFIVAAICGTTGILVTYFFVPDMTGVDFEDEDRKFMEYLEENGWTGVVGEDTDDTLSTVEKS